MQMSMAAKVAAALCSVLLVRIMLAPAADPVSSTSSVSATTNVASTIAELQTSIVEKKKAVAALSEEISSLRGPGDGGESEQRVEHPPEAVQNTPQSSTGSATSAKAILADIEPGVYEISFSIQQGRPLSINPADGFLSLGFEFGPITERSYSFQRIENNFWSIEVYGSGFFLEMRTVGAGDDWTVKADCVNPRVMESCRWKMRQGSGGGIYLYNEAAKGMLNLVQNKHVRGHREGGGGGASEGPTAQIILTPVSDKVIDEDSKPKQKIMPGSSEPVILQWMDSPKERDYVKQIKALPASTEKRVISFGLYGNNPKYTQGAIRNAEMKDTYFPGWVCRFYTDDSVPESIIERLEELGSEIVRQSHHTNGAIAGMFWRFLVADDETVDRFIVRDSDSRLNARDRFAVEEWIDSGKSVHTVRDHVNHIRTMNGGMWGGTKGCIPGGIENLVASFDKSKYMQDIRFLEQKVWPLIKDNQMGHDAYSCGSYPNSYPFPTKRDDNYQHVGQVFNERDEPRMDDIDNFIRNHENQIECRPEGHKDWVYG